MPEFDCLCLSARRAARSLTRMYEEELRPSGLTPAQFGLLNILAMRPGLTQMELATLVGADQTTLSRSLKLLLSEKLIKSTRSREDARETIHTLTAAGAIRHQAGKLHWEQADQMMRRKLGNDFGTALTLLRRVADAV